jgi:hypothetical protein
MDILHLINQPCEPWALEPDDLRDRVQSKLSNTCEEDGRTWRQRLLAGLASADVHIGVSLFMLGISAASLDELSPSDMGKLLRYVRINSPVAVEALAGLLAELLAAKQEPELVALRADQAA